MFFPSFLDFNNDNIMEKICIQCKIVKLFEKFNKDKYRKDGLTAYCKDCIIIRNQKYYELNKEKISKYYKINKTEILTQQREYYNINKDKSNAKVAKRRASKIYATPDWLTQNHKDQIRELYEIAQAFKLYTGEEYHVDHIIPLKGKDVCGLHVPWNLQVIPAKENLSKSNKLLEIK